MAQIKKKLNFLPYAVQRVQKDKKTWEQYQQIVQALSSDKNWKTYRATLKLSNPPCIPYLGML